MSSGNKEFEFEYCQIQREILVIYFKEKKPIVHIFIASKDLTFLIHAYLTTWLDSFVFYLYNITYVYDFVSLNRCIRWFDQGYCNIFMKTQWCQEFLTRHRQIEHEISCSWSIFVNHFLVCVHTPAKSLGLRLYTNLTTKYSAFVFLHPFLSFLI